MPARTTLGLEGGGLYNVSAFLVLVRVLGSEGGGFGGGPTSIGEKNECQQGRWASRGVDCDVPHWLGRRTKHPL